jgi:hypothetical protein
MCDGATQTRFPRYFELWFQQKVHRLTLGLQFTAWTGSACGDVTYNSSFERTKAQGRIVLAADLATIASSVFFSAWLVSPVVLVVSALFAGAKWLDGNTPNWWPALISGSLFVATSIAGLVRIWRIKRRRHDA